MVNIQVNSDPILSVSEKIAKSREKVARKNR
jgi:hypothetical protein